MNRSKAIILCTVFFMLVFAAGNALAEDRTGTGYILLKGGPFFPTTDLDRNGFVTSVSGELVVGTYYLKNLALEAGVGYFQTQASDSGAGFTEEDDLWVVPVTITFKGVIPFKGGEVNAGVGPGVYFANLRAEGTTPSGDFSNDGHAVAVGGHVTAGVNVDISRKVFVGAEGKYIFTTGAHLLGSTSKLNGVMVSGIVGYRF
jgi:outer membrane protein W